MVELSVYDETYDGDAVLSNIVYDIFQVQVTLQPVDYRCVVCKSSQSQLLQKYTE